ncbi:MAG: hypothetical protein V8Q84_00605 [Bilophila sp.]
MVVFMNDRPRRYLRERLRNAPDIPRPCLIPRMFTQRELMGAFRQARHPGPRREAGKLDQVALLSHCVRELAHPGTDLCVQLSKTDEAGFFPWGVRLANLLEECFSHGLTPDDMLYAEGEVAPSGRRCSVRSAPFSPATGRPSLRPISPPRASTPSWSQAPCGKNAPRGKTSRFRAFWPGARSCWPASGR